MEQSLIFFNSSQVLISSGFYSKLSQMPVVLIPLHFDRDSINRIPSCQHSVVLRPFITQDFMTGVPATPGKEIPEEVSYSVTKIISFHKV